ncbi:hypothetical protein HY086_07030 [Candidatus Gottesmanbacteria bacterium]|nr:hypothetical protein [Candidatus Gottesmanbacteria bacterium]
MNYVTTNIRFPEDVYLQLKAEAARKRMSLSAVVRKRVAGDRPVRSRAEVAKMLAEIDKTAVYLGRKLRGFDATAAIRQMREER